MPIRRPRRRPSTRRRHRQRSSDCAARTPLSSPPPPRLQRRSDVCRDIVHRSSGDDHVGRDVCGQRQPARFQPHARPHPSTADLLGRRARRAADAAPAARRIAWRARRAASNATRTSTSSRIAATTKSQIDRDGCSWIGASFAAGTEASGGVSGVAGGWAAGSSNEFEAVPSGSDQPGLIPGYCRPCVTCSGGLGFSCACSITAPIAAPPASSDKRTSAMPRRGAAVQLRCDRSIQPSVTHSDHRGRDGNRPTSARRPSASAPARTPTTPSRKQAAPARASGDGHGGEQRPAAKVDRAAGPFPLPDQVHDLAPAQGRPHHRRAALPDSREPGQDRRRRRRTAPPAGRTSERETS